VANPTITLPTEAIEHVQAALDRLEKLDVWTSKPEDVWRAIGFAQHAALRLRLWMRDCAEYGPIKKELEEQHG
jgi:hypothetical protein